MGTRPWLLTEGLKLSWQTSPLDLAAKHPMPPRALAGLRAVAVNGAAVCISVSQLLTMLEFLDCGGQIWAMTGWKLGMGCLPRCQALSTLSWR